jgi:uncharacterized protein (DUF2147 family)
MKKYFVTIFICFFAIVLLGSTVKAENEVTGIWKTISDEGSDKGKAKSHVEIFEKDNAYFAKVNKLLLKPQDTLCDKCKGDLKDKPVVGMIILQEMKKTGSIDTQLGEEYAGGTIMDPDNGKTYKCKLWVNGDVLTVRGFIGFSLLGRSQQWFRVTK